MGTDNPVSWGRGVDPVSVLGDQNFKEAVEGGEAEGQGMYPELEEFLSAMSGPTASRGPQFQWDKVHYDVFNVMHANSKQALEELSTRLATAENCILCNEETFFTKEGQYLVVLKWAEYKVEGSDDDASESGLATKPDPTGDSSVHPGL